MRKAFETLHTERQPTGARKFCRNPTKHQECDAMQYGHLLAVQNKFSLLEDQAWNNSARKISTNLRSISSFHLPCHDRANQICTIDRYVAYGYGSCSCPPHTFCSWVPGITSVAKRMINMDFHLTLEDFPLAGPSMSKVGCGEIEEMEELLIRWIYLFIYFFLVFDPTS